MQNMPMTIAKFLGRYYSLWGLVFVKHRGVVLPLSLSSQVLTSDPFKTTVLV